MKRTDFSKALSQLITISAGCLVATQTLAFVENDARALNLKSVLSRPETYLPRNASFSATNESREYDKISNAVRYLSGSKIFGVTVQGRNPADFETAAMSAITSHKAVFGVTSSEVRLNKKSTLVSGDDAAVSFHVFRGGLRIQDAGITFHFKKGSLILVKNETYAEAEAETTVRSDSGAIAANAVGGSGFIGRGSLYRVKPTAAGYSLAKVDEFLVSDGSEAYVVQVDTTNGSVFDVRTKNFELRGKATAKIYPRYFADTMQTVALPFTRPSGASANANDRGEFSTADDLTAPALEGILGQFISIKNDAGANLSATGMKVSNQWLINFDVSPNADVLWDNADVAQTMAYVNANKIISTAKKFINPEWFDKQLTVHVNNSQHCNAYWDGETINLFSAGEMRGKTCANTAVISDVIFHEWGHGLDDNTGGIDDSALSEGFGDALSLYMTDDPKIGVDFQPVAHLPVRNLTDKRVYPDDVVYEPHKDGLIVAGAWYDLYVALKAKRGAAPAKEIMGKFLFKGIYQFAKMSDVYKATLALDDNNADLNDGTPNLCLINKAFRDHGLADEDTRCSAN